MPADGEYKDADADTRCQKKIERPDEDMKEMQMTAMMPMTMKIR